MATSHTLATLDGNFKEVYAGKIEDLIPSNVKLTPKIPFVAAEKQLGDSYHQPVILADEHGATFSGTSASTNTGSAGDAFSLNAAVAGQVKDATIYGAEFVLRGQLSYAAASRAAGGRNAFVDSTSLLVKNMRRSVARKLETQLIYGNASIGRIDGTPTGNVITISTADWAPGIWAGAVGMKIQAYDALTGGTVQNTANSNVMTISAVDIANRTITVDDDAGLADNDFLFYNGAYENEFVGLHNIVSNTGTMFGIAGGTYNLWSGNSYNASGNLSMDKVTAAIDDQVGKGLDDDVTILVSTKTWTDMMADQASLRTLDSSYSNANLELGQQAITFWSQNGKIEVVPSIFVKEGFAYSFCPKDFVRIGSTDVTFQRPGHSDQFFMDLDSSAGYELRAYYDQALFCTAPGRQSLITGITNG